MTAQEVLETVAAMPQEDWMKIQCGIAELITAKLSSEEIAEIRGALAEAEAEFERGEGMSSEAIRRQLGLPRSQVVLGNASCSSRNSISR